MDDAIRKKCGKRTTKLQKEEIVSKYLTGKYTCKALGKEYGISGCSISSLLKRRSIPVNNNQVELQSKYILNHDYFNIIDMERKAYFLGFLFADGCNHQDNSIRISLQERDKYILEQLNTEIGSNRPLGFEKTSKYTKFKNAQDTYSLSITSQNMSEQLERLGCVRKKSLILKFPLKEHVPEHLIPHFIRGYFDGDGSFVAHMMKCKGGRYLHQQYKFSFTSTLEFCESVKKIIVDKFNIPVGIYERRKNSGKNSYELNITGKKVFDVLDWLYKDSTIHLHRKYNKYMKYRTALERKNNEKSITIN